MCCMERGIRICTDAEPPLAAEHAEDPPFGGLWCDQPALFLSRAFGLPDSCGPRAGKFIFAGMDGQQLATIHHALIAVQQSVINMTFPSCDQEDLIELINRVEGELHSQQPNVPLMCTFLNSIARSLRAQPEARAACLVIEDAIHAGGMPSTWQSGI